MSGSSAVPSHPAASSQPSGTWWSRLTVSIPAALCALFVSYFHQGVSNFVGDIFGAMPIAKQAAFPGTYPPQDILVDAGMRGPFHIYKAAGLLYRSGINVDLLWFCLLLVFLYLTFLALWHLAFEITRSRTLSTFTVVLLAMTNPWKGGLNWTPVPIPFLVTSLVAIPLGYFAFVLYFRQRFPAALLLSAAMFNIHPSGIIPLALTGSALLFQDPGRPLRTRLLWLGAGIVAALPNALYTFLSLPGNFVATAAVDPSSFYRLYRLFGYHTFLEDHWREGYGFFLLAAAAAAYFLRYLSAQMRQLLLYAAGVFAAMLLAYVLNLYVLRYRTGILLLLFRVTFFLKPALFAVIVHGCYHWVREHRADRPAGFFVPLAVSAGFLMSLTSGGTLESESFLLLAVSLVLRTQSSPKNTSMFLFASGTAAWSLCEIILFTAARYKLLHMDDGWKDLFLSLHILIGLILLVVLLKRGSSEDPVGPEVPAASGPFTGHGMRVLTAVVLGIILIKTGRVVHGYVKAERTGPSELERRIYFSRPHPVLEPLVTWARQNTPKASLFAVPPTDTMDSAMYTQLRIAAERGVYITLFDIYQLAYDVKVYREGFDRLAKLGVRVLGRHQIDDSAYHDLPPAALKRLRQEDGVDYAVFEKAKLGPSLQQWNFVFESDRFVVLDLRQFDRPPENH